MYIFIYLDGLKLIDIFDKTTTMVFMYVNNDFCVILSKYCLTDFGVGVFLYQLFLVIIVKIEVLKWFFSRFVQYGSKAAWHYMEKNNANIKSIENIKQLEKSLATFRQCKYFYLFHYLN